MSSRHNPSEVSMSNRTDLFLIVCAAALMVWSIRGESHELMQAHVHFTDAVAQPILPQLVVMALLAALLMTSVRLTRWMLVSSVRVLARAVPRR